MSSAVVEKPKLSAAEILRLLVERDGAIKEDVHVGIEAYGGRKHITIVNKGN